MWTHFEARPTGSHSFGPYTHPCQTSRLDVIRMTLHRAG